MIYFIKGGGFVKIGYSKNPRARLKELQTGNPNKLKLLATMPGTYSTEATLHEMFKSQRAHGEWFHNNGKLTKCIHALRGDPDNAFEIRCPKTLMKAGMNLQCRQKRNRNKTFRNKLKRLNLL